MGFYVSGEFWEITLIYEENLFGGIKFWCFLEFCSRFHVRLLRRGALCVHLEEFKMGNSPECGWGDLICAKGELFGELP
jgi:hypothetical protein